MDGGWNWLTIRSALFWDITQRRVVNVYRRFGTTYGSHFHGSRLRVVASLLGLLTREDGTYTFPRNVGKQLPHDAAYISEERRSQHRGGSLKPCLTIASNRRRWFQRDLQISLSDRLMDTRMNEGQVSAQQTTNFSDLYVNRHTRKCDFRDAHCT